MKLRQLLTTTLIGLGLTLTGCQQKDHGVNGGEAPLPEGTTYMSVSINNLVPEMARTRANEDGRFNDKGQWAGRDAIKNVLVYIIDETTGTVSKQTLEPRTGAEHSVNAGKVSDFKVWKTTPGKKTLYAVVNGAGTAYEAALNAATAANFATQYAAVLDDFTTGGRVNEAYAKFDTAEKKDIILMTGAPAEVDVIRGVTKAQAEGGANKADISVRRAVAQAVVTYESANAPAGSFEVKVEDKTIATLSNLKWDIAQYEQKAKAYEALNQPDAIKTANFDFIPTATTYDAAVLDRYSYPTQSLIALQPFARATGATADQIMPQLLGTAFDKDWSKFLVETTHQLGGPLQVDGGTGTETGYRKGNTPYFMIEATITPDDTAWANDEEKNKPAGDLHYAGGKFYRDLTAAREAVANRTRQNVAGNDPLLQQQDNVLTYKGGKCYYFYWLNPDAQTVNGTADMPINSPIVRNNIYHVNITSFLKLGLTGNPLYPGTDNPNKPDPDDPNTPKPEEPLYDTDTYMTCDINIVPWGVHSFDKGF